MNYSSDRLLAMGTASGKVFFSFLSDTPRRSGEDVRGATQGRPFSVAKGVQCSCAPVSCITWAVDGRQVHCFVVVIVVIFLFFWFKFHQQPI